jgi:hypothetical protein
MLPLRLSFRSAANRAISLVCRKEFFVAGAFALLAGWTATASAQSTSRGRYFPLDQTTPPGVAGQWSAIRPGFAMVMQPVRVELAGQGGEVGIYTGPDERPALLPAPAVVALRIGSTYRLKISDMADFPGVELYPTVEMLDCLHPPRGREIEFAIPIVLTADEIAAALDGRLVTKVIYLEQPDRAAPVRNTTAARNRLAQPRDNALALADEAGRPMAIVRLGGRLPDAGAPGPGFFGNCAPVLFIEQPGEVREAVQR